MRKEKDGKTKRRMSIAEGCEIRLFSTVLIDCIKWQWLRWQIKKEWSRSFHHNSQPHSKQRATATGNSTRHNEPDTIREALSIEPMMAMMSMKWNDKDLYRVHSAFCSSTTLFNCRQLQYKLPQIKPNPDIIYCVQFSDEYWHCFNSRHSYSYVTS